MNIELIRNMNDYQLQLFLRGIELSAQEHEETKARLKKAESERDEYKKHLEQANWRSGLNN